LLIYFDLIKKSDSEELAEGIQPPEGSCKKEEKKIKNAGIILNITTSINLIFN
jgi:hypothetical protein